MPSNIAHWSLVILHIWNKIASFFVLIKFLSVRESKSISIFVYCYLKFRISPHQANNKYGQKSQNKAMQ